MPSTPPPGHDLWSMLGVAAAGGGLFKLLDSLLSWRGQRQSEGRNRQTDARDGEKYWREIASGAEKTNLELQRANLELMRANLALEGDNLEWKRKFTTLSERFTDLEKRFTIIEGERDTLRARVTELETQMLGPRESERQAAHKRGEGSVS